MFECAVVEGLGAVGGVKNLYGWYYMGSDVTAVVQ